MRRPNFNQFDSVLVLTVQVIAVYILPDQIQLIFPLIRTQNLKIDNRLLDNTFSGASPTVDNFECGVSEVRDPQNSKFHFPHKFTRISKSKTRQRETMFSSGLKQLDLVPSI